jgi:hypothetical protein
MRVAKATNKEIVARVKKKQALDSKANVTFRLNIALMDQFRAKCEQLDMSMAVILEELISDFLR